MGKQRNVRDPNRTDHLRSWVFFVDCVDFLSDVASVDCLAFC